MSTPPNITIRFDQTRTCCPCCEDDGEPIWPERDWREPEPPSPEVRAEARAALEDFMSRARILERIDALEGHDHG